jgi:hypothetical protein
MRSIAPLHVASEIAMAGGNTPLMILNQSLDRLADAVENALDMRRLEEILNSQERVAT